MPFLTPEQVAFYHENGYLVLENFWESETVDKLKQRIEEIVGNADLSAITSVFSTQEQHRNNLDEYFLTSGGEIRFFWEERARDADGKLLVAPQKAINKVGHALHDLDEDFRAVSYEPRVGSICAELGLERPTAVQSMYIFKQARVGGLVVPHQDGTFLYTRPQTCIGLWWPLHDCTEQNGCLWAVPGSHRLGVQRRFRRKDPPQQGTEFQPAEPEQFDTSSAVPLRTPRGSLVVLHNALVHFSQENHSEVPRHAYSIHVVDGKEGVEYPADNWLQRPKEQPFREITARVQ